MVFAIIHRYLIISNILYKSIKYIIKCTNTHTHTESVVKEGLREENIWAKTWRKWVTEPGGYMRQVPSKQKFLVIIGAQEMNNFLSV